MNLCVLSSPGGIPKSDIAGSQLNVCLILLEAARAFSKGLTYPFYIPINDVRELRIFRILTNFCVDVFFQK